MGAGLQQWRSLAHSMSHSIVQLATDASMHVDSSRRAPQSIVAYEQQHRKGQRSAQALASCCACHGQLAGSVAGCTGNTINPFTSKVTQAKVAVTLDANCKAAPTSGEHSSVYDSKSVRVELSRCSTLSSCI